MNILIIGGGNMGEALARGLLKSKNDTKNTISIAEIDANRRTELSALPVTVIADTSLGFNNADVVILAVKPQVMNELLLSLSGLSSNNPLFVSIAAGITTTTIEELLKKFTSCASHAKHTGPRSKWHHGNLSRQIRNHIRYCFNH